MHETTTSPIGARLQPLWVPVEIGPLVFFRIVFGCLMAWHVASMWTSGWIDGQYIDPVFHFSYPGFGWAAPWPDQWLPVHFGVMGFSAVALALGWFYRVSATIFSLTFIHAFLMEKALYQNHYYLICLLSLLMIVVPCHRAYSLDALRRPEIRSATAPAWTLTLLRFQIAIPYVYGGIAKIDGDWLQGMPMRLWLERRAATAAAGDVLAEDWVVYLLSYGGLAYDLAIVPLLLWKRTRVVAFWSAVAFHLANAWLWHIGVFPWLMIGATALFLDPAWFQKLSRLPPKPVGSSRSVERAGAGKLLTAGLLGVYVAWQLVTPLRHHLYPGNASWTEEGHYFSWRMMLREKNVAIRFYVVDPVRGKRGIVQVSSFLNYRQLSRMGRDADMVVEFVHFVRNHYQAHGREGLEIYVLDLVSLNGRKPQLLLNPTLNYALVERRLLAPQPWILPLEEPLPQQPWDVPVHQWETVLDLDLPAAMALP